MATTKRQPHDSVGKPTISVAAERTAQSLSGERQALMARRARLIGAVALPIAVVAGLLLFFRPFAPASSGTTAPALATAAPTVQPSAMPAAAAPVVQPTAVPSNPTAAPAATAAPQPAAPAAAVIACDAIGGLPLYTGANCIKHDLDHDDGLIKAENTYTAAASADDVRRFYEGAFASNGWVVQESDYDGEDIAWKYTVARGQQRLKVEVETQTGPNGAYTRIKIGEK
jgi:hypothetical protein